MIVCSCNVLTDSDVRSAVATAPSRPRTAGQVYGCLGCSAQCGRCARTIRRLLAEAQAATQGQPVPDTAAATACASTCQCCPRNAPAGTAGG